MDQPLTAYIQSSGETLCGRRSLPVLPPPWVGCRQSRPSRRVPVRFLQRSPVGLSCVNPTLKPVADAARSSAHPVFSFIERSTRSLHTRNVESEKGLKNYGTDFVNLGLFPVREGHKLIQNFLQSSEPPFVVGGCPSISPVHLRAVRFTNLGYFFPKFLDTL